MKLLYKQEIKSKNGQVEKTSEVLSGESFGIGRAPANEILLEDKLVSLNHARLSIVNNQLVIEDLDSLSGIRVNKKASRRSILSAGDVIKIGGSVFHVIFEDETWGVCEIRDELAQLDNEQKVEKVYSQFQFSNNVPSYASISIAVGVVCAVIFLFAPIAGLNKSSWLSGPSSSSHGLFIEDCATCHVTPFVRVQDKQCLACHKVSDHADVMSKLFESHPEVDVSCATCHMEHNGLKNLTVDDKALCTTCHADLSEKLPDTVKLDVSSIHEHPEFRLKSEGEQGFEYIDFNSPKAKDTSAIKLNHEVHLRPDLEGPEGPTQLTCGSCHEFSDDRRSIVDISYEKHCQSCHNLEFDERFPGTSVPHGEPDLVFDFLLAEYAKGFLLDTHQEVEFSSTRKKPGNKVTRLEQKELFAKETIVPAARAAEEQLFTKTACHLCHFVSKKEFFNTTESPYLVEKPNIPGRWFPGSIFDHGAHQAIECASCHEGASSSTETEDISLPGKDLCLECHSDISPHNVVPTNCITCHSYHDSEMFETDKKKDTWLTKELGN